MLERLFRSKAISTNDEVASVLSQRADAVLTRRRRPQRKRAEVSAASGQVVLIFDDLAVLLRFAARGLRITTRSRALSCRAFISE